MKELGTTALPGLVMIFVEFGILIGSIASVISSAKGHGEGAPLGVFYGMLGVGLFVLLLPGFMSVQPNTGIVLTLFGKYKGTVKTAGLQWANPFYAKKPISLRVRNFETTHLKVNDKDGNPIEIAAVVVWKVVDSAEASFQVDDYENYVKVQSEAALRSLAPAYPYDAHTEGDLSLRANASEVSAHLKDQLHQRLQVAGVETVDARISHLAYSPEIAASMLQRQQASAIISARKMIVEGAVGMVEMALERLSRNNVVQLDEERKATMVSNLLVVLCGERSVQPVVNAGTLYQ